MNDFIRIHQSRTVSYDFEDVMELDKEWYDEFIAQNPTASPRDIWEAAEENGFQFDSERIEPNYDDEIHDTWLEDDNG